MKKKYRKDSGEDEWRGSSRKGKKKGVGRSEEEGDIVGLRERKET